MIELTLRDFRLKLGMTVDDMAEELNVPKQTYWHWEGKNKPPEDAIQKVRKIYDKTKEFMVDDDIDIIEKISTIKRHYRLSHDSLAQLVGAKYGTSVVNWMNGVQPRLKYMIRINELYYGIANKKRKTKARSRATFCRINPLDRESWKAEIQSPIITWR